jgi:hypothetical protein
MQASHVRGLVSWVPAICRRRDFDTAGMALCFDWFEEAAK